MTQPATVVGRIGRPETVHEALLLALRDMSIAYKRSPDEVLKALPVYENVLRGVLPEAVLMGTQHALEEERFFPAPAVLRRYVMDEHHKLIRSRNAVVPSREESNGLRCPICGAVAYSNNNRLQMDHDARAHGVTRGRLV